jgi:signal transduction histidine kinase
MHTILGLNDKSFGIFENYPLLLILISTLLAFISFVLVFSMTAPIKELVRKAEEIVRIDNRKAMRGQLREVYETIEGLIEYIKTQKPTASTEGSKMAKDIERLDYIIPLGYMSLVIAHEVRNPLSTIRGMCELLLNRLGEGKERLYLESIFEATKRIDKFTRELLDFTDIEPVMTEFDLSGLIGML